MALLDITFDMIQKEFQKEPPTWTTTSWNKPNRDFVVNECTRPSEFDPSNVRNKMIQRIDDSTVVTCDYGTIHVIYSNEQQKQEIPWELWGRILRLYCHTGKPFTIFFLAAPHLREFPDKGPITPYNINGGYTYPCNHNTIVIYRAEDATRVLIHELQHSCCLDHREHGIDRIEAETEAWAELIYCALLSHGNRQEFHRLIKRQSVWIQQQNRRIQHYIGDSTSFPWRYTVGKEEVWKRWNILRSGGVSSQINSLRLTAPPSTHLKKKFDVRVSSTIL
jgi:hypothetical protein